MPHDKEIIYAYLAGFIDADGSIGIVKTRSKYKTNNGVKVSTQYRVKLSAHNCRLDPIKLLQKEFGGGKIRHKKTGKTKLHDNWRPCYEWILTNVQATNALRAMLPYLLIKKEQAELCIQLNDLKRGYKPVERRWNPKLNQNCIDVSETLKQKCNMLNKRGQ